MSDLTTDDMLRVYGKNALGSIMQPERVLEILYEDQQLSTPEIARLVGCSATNIRYAMDKHGIPRRPPGWKARGQIEEAAVRLGYDSLGDFFEEHSRADSLKSFEWMGKELGVSAATVGKYFDSWTASFHSEG